MRTLTANATAEKIRKNSMPINILKIEWGGSIGDKYYSDRIISIPVLVEPELITNWGTMSFMKTLGQIKALLSK